MKKIISAIRRFRLTVFWVIVVAIILAIVYSLYSDASSNRIQCGTNQGVTSYLVLRSIEPAPNQIKSGLSILPFNPEDESLEVNTVTRGPSSNILYYDSVFKTPSGQQGVDTGNSSNQPWKINLWYSSHPFWYPFEEYLMNVKIDFRKNGNVVPLNLTAVDRVDQATIAKCTQGYSFESTASDPNGFTLILRRHLFIRFTAMILYSVAVLFLVYIWKRENANQVFASSLGYLVALWGIRGVIVGPTNLFPTIIDFLTLVLYLAVVAILIHRWLIDLDRPKHQNRDLVEQEEKNHKALRLS